MLAGQPCGPYALSGKGIFFADPRALYLLGIGTAACMRIQSLYWIAGGDGTHALIKVNEVMESADYHRLVPGNVAGVKRVHAASLGSAVFCNRVILHYEKKNQGCVARVRAARVVGQRHDGREIYVASRLE